MSQSQHKAWHATRFSKSANVALRPQKPQGLLGTWSPRRPPRLSLTRLLISDSPKVQCCFMSTEIMRTIRDVETRTATSTFAQLLNSATVEAIQAYVQLQPPFSPDSDNRKSPSSSSVLLYVHRDHKTYVRDGEPGMTTSTFTQLLSSDRTHVT